jgi:hypothetical protein
LFTKGVPKFNKFFLFAHWAVAINCVAMPFCSAHQIRISVAGINGSTKQGYQGSSLVE